MKTLRFLLVGAVALMAFEGCSKTDELVDTTPVYDDAYYASYASISSSDSGFTSNSTGGTIHFKVEGGEVKVFVSCGTDWVVHNSNPNSFNAYASDSYYLTVSAGQNLVEEELTGTITLMTAEMRIAFASITVTQNAYGAPEITVSSNEWHAPAVGKLTTTITVDSTDEWTIDGGDEWLTIEKSGVGINLTVGENEDTEERTAEIVLTCTDGYNSDSETITVTQDGLAYITLGEDELSLPQFGDPVSVTVETNFDWEYSFNADWLTIDNDEKEGTLVITYDTNSTGKARDCVVTITSGDGASNVAEAELAITQVAHSLTVDTSEWHAPAVGELTKEIEVEAPDDWMAEVKVDWLTVEKTETGIALTANENTEITERSGEVVISCVNELYSDSITVTVTQDGLAFIELNEEELLLAAVGNNSTISIASNYDWECSYNSDWFAITREGDNSLTITYSTNETETAREAVVTFTAGDGAANIAEATLKIFQYAYKDALILEYSTSYSYGGVKIQLPIISATNAVIDWGDGNTSITSSDNPSHTYPSEGGTYTVTINGTVKGLFSGIRNTSTIPGTSSLSSVIQWGNTGLEDLSNAFYYCTNLKSLPAEAGTSLKNVTTFSEAFYRCSSLSSAPSFEGCSSATSFYGAFYQCYALNTVPENMFSGCTAAESFELIFYQCSSLVSAPSFKGCSSATSFYRAFYQCYALVYGPSFEGCSSATSFADAFHNCYALTTVPEDMFLGCTSATSFAYTFYNCNALVNAPSFKGCSAATSFYQTFYGCTSLVNASSFENCSSATTFEQTFYICKSLTTIPENMFSACTAVTSFEDTFRGCTALTTVPENMFSSCTATTTFRETFYNCSSLKTVPVSLFDNNLLVTNFYMTFFGCSSVSGESPYTEVDVEGEKVNVHLYQRSNYPEYMGCSTPGSYSDCFRYSTFSDIDSIPSYWGGNGK